MLHSINKNKSLKEQLLPMDIVKLRDGRIGVIFPNDNDTETGLAIFGQGGCINYLNNYDKNLKYARFNDANDIISICRAPKYCFSLIRDLFEYKSLEEIEKEYITWDIEINKEFAPTIEEGDFVLLRDKRICKVKVHKYNPEIFNFVSIFDEGYIISNINFYDDVWNNLNNPEKYDVIAVKKSINNNWLSDPIDNLTWDYRRDPDTGNWWGTIKESN